MENNFTRIEAIINVTFTFWDAINTTADGSELTKVLFWVLSNFPEENFLQIMKLRFSFF